MELQISHCFAPKCGRRVFYNNNRLEIDQILRELCRWKGVNIVNAEVCLDHIHMLEEIPPKINISSFIGLLFAPKSDIMYSMEILLMKRGGEVLI